MTLSQYVRVQTTVLIRQVHEQSHRVEIDTSDEAIHDLRVAIRRLSETLRVFKDLFPGGAAKAVRKDLKTAMRRAGRTRNCDIARELMAKARMPASAELTDDRDQAAKDLADMLSRWNKKARSQKWQEHLHV